MYTIDQWIERFSLLYGVRNSYGVPSPTALGQHLDIEISKLVEKIIRDRGHISAPAALSDVFGWALGFANHLKKLPLAKQMACNYGGQTCRDCQQKKCNCPKKRGETNKLIETPGSVRRETASLLGPLSMTISQWQVHLDGLYGVGNRENGVQFCLLRLWCEASETVKNIRSFNTSRRHNIGRRRNLIAAELADVLAWSFAIANVQGIDLSAALMARYGQPYDGCTPECPKFLCTCGALIEKQDDYYAFDPLKDDDEKANTATVE